MKNGEIWISAVLYIALATILLSIILVAGLPVINKLRDKNVVIQTKDVMFGINRAIRTVVQEGPGSQRTISLDIGRGELRIYDSKEHINWTMKTEALLSSLNNVIKEGDVNILTRETNIVGEYEIMLSLDYNSLIDITITGSDSLTGRHNLIIRNNGVVNVLPNVVINEVS